MHWFTLRHTRWPALFILLIFLSACAAPTTAPALPPSSIPPIVAMVTTAAPTDTAVPAATTAAPTATQPPRTESPTFTATSLPTETATATSAPPTPSGEDAIYAYYPLEEAATKGGKKASCSTDVIPVNTGLARTGNVEADVTSALGRLFQKKQYVAGRYNPAYLSNIEVKSVEFNSYSGLVSVNLTGTYVRSGDRCDDSRVREQVWNTVRQFPGVKTAYILLNDNLLGDILATGK